MHSVVSFTQVLMRAIPLHELAVTLLYGPIFLHAWFLS